MEKRKPRPRVRKRYSEDEYTDSSHGSHGNHGNYPTHEQKRRLSSDDDEGSFIDKNFSESDESALDSFTDDEELSEENDVLK